MNINSASIQNPTRIAVVMATCNGAAFIEQQLHSLLQQTLQPDLIIIRDDASEDATFEILTRFANQPGFNISQNCLSGRQRIRIAASNSSTHASAFNRVQTSQ